MIELFILSRQLSFEEGVFFIMSLAQELVHGINRKVRGGNVMLNIDMAHAYDRMNWCFLLEILRRLGFSNKWRNLIFNAIYSPYYSVILNG